MNSETTDCSSCGSKTAYATAIFGAFLIVAGLVWAMRHYTQVQPVNANRAAERSKAFTEMRAAETEALNNVGWIDPGKGIVRLRVQDAMKLVEQQWGKDPAAARKEMIARVEKANAVPPAAPVQPSQFE
ncbi:MAG: hypothetical protein H7Y43_10540 [Akkermansiaceae bacterium]|nr:hypothetical protein [Verrucomicrobiales bacterium]